MSVHQMDIKQYFVVLCNRVVSHNFRKVLGQFGNLRVGLLFAEKVSGRHQGRVIQFGKHFQDEILVDGRIFDQELGIAVNEEGISLVGPVVISSQMEVEERQALVSGIFNQYVPYRSFQLIPITTNLTSFTHPRTLDCKKLCVNSLMVSLASLVWMYNVQQIRKVCNR